MRGENSGRDDWETPTKADIVDRIELSEFRKDAAMIQDNPQCAENKVKRVFPLAFVYETAGYEYCVKSGISEPKYLGCASESEDAAWLSAAEEVAKHR